MLDGVTVPRTKFCITAESKLSLSYVFNLSTQGKMTFWKCVTRNAPKNYISVLRCKSLLYVRIASRTYSDLVCGACGPSNAERSVHTSANLIFHFPNKNGKRKYYVFLLYLHILKYRKKEKKRKRSGKSIIFSFF